MKANGRINLLNAPNHMVLFDRSPTPFKEAMAGNWENTPLSNLFFSPQNQQTLQNGLRAGVYHMSNQKYVIAPQSNDDLKIVMRSIFMQYSSNQPGNITQQINELNKAVLNYSVPQIYGEAKGYLRYLHDASTLVVPLSTPVNTVSYDKTLELKPFF
jgi:hypothetical protein